MPYSRLFYHFVWSTKNRLPLITDSIRDPLYASIRAKAVELRGMVHALNGMPDHMHLVATVLPSMALSTFIGQVKGASSHLIGRLSGQPFAWQNEYGVFSVSESDLSVVVRYVIEQQKHHAESSLEMGFERAADTGLAGA